MARGAVAMDMDLAGNSPPAAFNSHAGEKIPVPSSEASGVNTSTAHPDDVRDGIEVYLEDLGSVIYAERPPCTFVGANEDDPKFHAHVESARVTDIGT